MIYLVYFSVCFLIFASSYAYGQYNLSVDASQGGRAIPSKLFGIFFEEINHAGSGGLWAELVSNRGFEAGGRNTPSGIDPWMLIGDEASVWVETEPSSPFKQNPVALRVEVLCDDCPEGGVGVYNPGYWGMNIVAGAQYKVTFWARSSDEISLTLTFSSSDGKRILAQDFVDLDSDCGCWEKQEILLLANDTDNYGRLSLTSSQKGVFWLDQVSAMPVDTYKGHGFRKDLALMLENLKPKFIRFPGGSYVEGDWLRNAYRWRSAIGPWEERPGHFGDVWGYWSDDGMGFYELLQLAEDLNAAPIWVFNAGISFHDGVPPSLIQPFIKDVLNSIEFARGPSTSTWGAVRASMGHPHPFVLEYVAIGNEDCARQYYVANYVKIYAAIKKAYPDIMIISNCDGSAKQLDHPADLFDYHIYTSASRIFSMSHQFDNARRSGPKAFVSEYAVTGKDAGKGSLYAALGEAGFLIGIEKNSDVVELASYAPLFVNNNDRRWNPDAIVFDAWQSYGTPSYWMQTFFVNSSGATLLPTVLNGDKSGINNIASSAIRRFNDDDNLEYIDIKIVNFGKTNIIVKVTITGLKSDEINEEGMITRLTSSNVMDENTFSTKDKVVPRTESVHNVGTVMNVGIPASSLNMITLQLITPLTRAFM